MKLSVSVSDDQVAFIDKYASAHALASRSGVVQRALTLLRVSELADDYAGAFDEWASGDAEAWEATVGDGVD